MMTTTSSADARHGAPPAPGPTDFLPSRVLPLLYLGLAHACLAIVFGVLVSSPGRTFGFYYQPRMFALVHLITLGWITSSILGSLYLVAPLALRVSLRARWLDYAAFALFAIGVGGMASHFWIDRAVGMLWAAPLVPVAILRVAWRVFPAVRRAPIPAEVRVHVVLALVNVFLAAGLGFLLGLNKVQAIVTLPGFPGVVAHAHLAAVGFAAMIAMGVGYRLLPMLLPSAMPRGAWAWSTALLTEAGVLAIVTGALAAEPLYAPGAALAGAGLAAFLSRVAWMLRHPRPAPPERRRPDWGLAHVFASFLWLALAIGLGLALAVLPASDETMALAKVYGLAGLLGFLSQLIVGVEARLLPLAAWLWSYAGGGHRELPPSLHEAPSRPAQAAAFWLWNAGLVALAFGLHGDRGRLVSTAGALLLIAVAARVVDAAVGLRRLHTRGASG
jgi:hypothetical protein